MGYGRFSTQQVSDWLDQIMAMSLWATLFIDNPFLHPGAEHTVEIPGAGFLRQAYTPNRVSPDLVNNANLIAFLALAPATSIVAAGAFDDETAGAFRFGVLLDAPYNLPSGGNYSIGVGLLAAGLDVGTGP